MVILYLIVGFVVAKLLLGIIEEQGKYIYIGPFDFFIPASGTNGKVQEVLRQMKVSPVLSPPGVKVSSYGFSVTLPLKREYTGKTIKAVANGIKIALTTGLYKTKVRRVPGGVMVHIPKVKIKT